VDGLGRPLQTRSEGEDGAVVVKVGVRFNGRGGIGEQWLPYYALTPTLGFVAPEAAQPKTTLSYDPLLRPVQLTHPDNTFTKTVFAPLAEAQFDEEDNAPTSSHFNTPMSYRYDGLGRLVQVLERNAGAVYTTTYGYDLLDNLAVITDTLGNVKKQSFDALKRKLRIDDPDAGTKTFVYDAAGNVTETVDAKGQRILFTYDGANRPLSENFVLAAGDATSDIVYHYDDDKASEYANAQHTLGRLSWVEDESGREYLSYDARGNVVGKIKRIKLPDTGGTQDFVMLTQFDALDRPIKLTYPDGFSVTYRYNAQALLEAIPNFVGNLDYAASGQLLKRNTNDGATTLQTYDQRLRLKTLRTLAANNTALQDWQYQFDEASNITQIDDLRTTRTVADDDSRRFVMDDLYRLTKASYLAGAKDVIAYAYNPIGNMTRMTATLPSANLGEMTYGQNAGPHALTQVGGASWAYDRNGNLISKPGFAYGWDTRDRLRVVTGTNGLKQSHTYDRANQRATKWVQTTQGSTLTLYPDRLVEVRDGRLIKYVFAGEMRVAEVRTPLQSVEWLRGFAGVLPGTLAHKAYLPVVLKSSVRLDVVQIGLMVQPEMPTAEAAQEQTVFYHADHLGSASVLVDGQGVVLERSSYLPFGAERVGSGDSGVSRRFTGHVRDVDIGLDYAGARYLNVVTGRFVSVDPLYRSAPDLAIHSPQKLNTFAYASNNPQNRIDSSGLDDRPVNWSGVAWAIHDMGNALLNVAEGAGIALVGAPTPAVPVTTVAGGLLMGKGVVDFGVAASSLIQSVMGDEPTASSFFELMAVVGSGAAKLSPSQTASLKLLASTADTLIGGPKSPGIKAGFAALKSDAKLIHFSVETTKNVGGFMKDLSTAQQQTRSTQAHTNPARSAPARSAPHASPKPVHIPKGK
jgi:RHS repeat-associated protein